MIIVPKNFPPIIAEQSLESAEWLKIYYLQSQKGYSYEEAVKIIEKLLVGKILDITAVPNKEK